MSQNLPPVEQTDEPSVSPRRSWQRPLSYLLLLAGVVATFLNSDIGRILGISTFVIQIAALGLLLAGAALFYSVRERVDRVSSYRQAFTQVDAPDSSDPEKESFEKKNSDNHQN